MANRGIKRQTSPSIQITNVGQLVACLRSYPEEEPLDQVNREVLRAILLKLRCILDKSGSELNNDKIHAIRNCAVDREVSKYFDSWHKDPATFWELSLLELPKYSELSATKEKLRVFFTGVLKQDVQLKVRRIQWRFITISAHRQFRRQHPTGKVTGDKVRLYLRDLGLSVSADEVSRCMSILTSGQRRLEFCAGLQTAPRSEALKSQYATPAAKRGQSKPITSRGLVNCAPMFMEAIPDDM